MSRLINIVGKIYGRLTVTDQAESTTYGSTRWKCKCECGNEIIVNRSSLIRGMTKSCGCYRKEVKTTHGINKHPIHRAYYNARGRCTNPKNKKWGAYGGRGIQFRLGTVKKFMENMFSTWAEGLSLDRIDNNGHYEYGNLRWITQREQNKNRRDNVWVSFNGETLILMDWARRFGMCHGTLRRRIKKWGVEKAFSMPPKLYTPKERNE